uniref:Ribonucleases P/MRP protein subunit POP1-like n=1 Tax=Hirondellea gigas TaxID=1518452 RepID=A0A2P2I215_9CRUS
MSTEAVDASGYAVYIHLAGARVEESHLLNEHLVECESKHGQRTYQKLPRHMQRRAVSSNPKRLPRGLREAHKKESLPPRATKRPHRSYRTRSRDLVSMYHKRQQREGNTWLETHVWHAKRFHMTRNWGYALPTCSTLKMYRPVLRAVNERCVMQDQSFLCCLEVCGPESVLCSGLSQILSQEGHRRITESNCRAGLQWTTVTLYVLKRCPQGAICEADIMWHAQPPANVPVKLWIWVHPSAYSQIVELLSTVFELNKVDESCPLDSSEQLSTSPISNIKIKNTVDVELLDNKENEDLSGVVDVKSKAQKVEKCTKNIKSKKRTLDDFDSKMHIDISSKSKKRRKNDLLKDRLDNDLAPQFNNKATGVSVVSLKDTLNRFCLRGPETYNILQRVLVSSEIITADATLDDSDVKTTDANANTGTNTVLATEDNGLWWQQFYSSKERKDAYQANTNAWMDLKGKTVTADTVLPLLVRDPRVMMPRKREKIVPIDDEEKSKAAAVQYTSPAVVAGSPLFDARLRRTLLFSKCSDNDINKQRQQMLTCAAITLDGREARLPVVLMLSSAQNTRCADNSDRSSSWSLIIPGGWGSNVWVSLVYSGAVVVGTDHQTYFVNEEITTPPVYLLPDTDSGKHYAQQLAKERRDSFFRLPPNKRPNLIKLGVRHPFKAPWQKLVQSVKLMSDSIKNAEETKIGTGFLNEVLMEVEKGVADYCAGQFDSGKKSFADSKSTYCKDLKSSLEEVCVMRNARYLKALDFLCCRSGNRRRVFRGVEEREHSNDLRSDTSPSSSVPADDAVSPESKMMCKSDIEELTDTLNLIHLTSQTQLLRVMLTLIGKGSLEPCATICRPSHEDMKCLQHALSTNVLPSANFADNILESAHLDIYEEERKQMKKEHAKILLRLQRLRKAARRKVRMEFSPTVAAAGQTLTHAMEAAVQKVNMDNKELVEKATAYNSVMEQLWLLPEDEDTHIQLQQTQKHQEKRRVCDKQQHVPEECVRITIGYITEANFSRRRGCAAGQGYVVTGAVMPVCQRRLRNWSTAVIVDNNDTLAGSIANEEPASSIVNNDPTICNVNNSARVASDDPAPNDTVTNCNSTAWDIDMPLINENGIVVLVRNSTLQYRFAMLTVCQQQPPP